MTHPILTKLAKSREALLAAIADLPEETLDRHPADGWTIRQVLTHLVNAEEDHCQVIEVIVRGETDRLPAEFSLDEHNERRVAERARWTRSELLDALTAQRRETEALLNRLSADQLALRGRHPVLGEKSVDELFRIIALHERMHAQEIAAFFKPR